MKATMFYYEVRINGARLETRHNTWQDAKDVLDVLAEKKLIKEQDRVLIVQVCTTEVEDEIEIKDGKAILKLNI